jgi:hypothetical protein
MLSVDLTCKVIKMSDAQRLDSMYGEAIACLRYVIINVFNVEKYLAVSWYALLIRAVIRSIIADVVYAMVQRLLPR